MLSAVAKQRGRTNDEAKAASRSLFLKAGAELLGEDSKRNPFASIRLRDLCQRAGLSSGAFFVHWRTLEEYYAQLGQDLMNGSTDGLVAITSDLPSLASLDDPGELPLTEAILRVADADLDSLLQNEFWDVSQLLFVTWGRGPLQEAGARGYVEIDDVTADVYGGLLERYGREPRPPLTRHEVAALLQALVEGIGMRSKVGLKERVNTGDEEVSLFAVGAAALLATITQPVGGGDRELFDHLRSILDSHSPNE